MLIISTRSIALGMDETFPRTIVKGTLLPCPGTMGEIDLSSLIFPIEKKNKVGNE